MIIETARAFYGALRAAREVEINESSLKRAEQQQKVSRARLSAGTATKTLVLEGRRRGGRNIRPSSLARGTTLITLIWRLSRITGVEAGGI